MTNIEEIWKPIIGRHGYEVSNFGNARTIDRLVITKSKQAQIPRRIFKGHPMPLLNNGHDYLVVCTQINCKKKNYYIHRLVAEYFIPNPNNKPEVNHKDGNKLNNHVLNLEWSTRKENAEHAKVNRLLPRGEEKWNSILTEKQVIDIKRQSRYRGLVPKLARKYNVSNGTIQGIFSGKNWAYLS